METNISEDAGPADAIPKRFFLGQQRKYSLHEKYELAKLIDRFKMEYDEYIKHPKKIFNSKTKKMQTLKPRDGYISKSIREFYYDLKNVPSSDKGFRNCYNMAERAYKSFKNGGFDTLEAETSSAKKFRFEGGGPQVKAPGLRNELFQWFVDIRHSGKGRLPKFIFINKFYIDIIFINFMSFRWVSFI